MNPFESSREASFVFRRGIGKKPTCVRTWTQVYRVRAHSGKASLISAGLVPLLRELARSGAFYTQILSLDIPLYRSGVITRVRFFFAKIGVKTRYDDFATTDIQSQFPDRLFES